MCEHRVFQQLLRAVHELLGLEDFVFLVQASKGCAILPIASGLPRANLPLAKTQVRKLHYSTLPNSLFCLGVFLFVWGGRVFVWGFFVVLRWV